MSTTLMVASAGGHLAELYRLRARLPDKDARTVWITADHPHGRSLLKDREAYFLPRVGSRDPLGALRDTVTASRILDQVKPDWIVSNGASLAVSVFLAASVRGIPCSYLENSVRVAGPSLSARIVSRFPGVELFTQYPQLVDRRWRQMGSVLTQWQAVANPRPRPLRRVVVTVGTMEWPFERLFRRLAEVVPADCEVIWQSGCNDISHLGLKGVASMPAADLEAAIREADLVIAHAGIGSAIAAFDNGKFPLMAARLMTRGEAVDDHQSHIGEVMQAQGLCRLVDADAIELADLEEAAAMSVIEAPAPPDVLDASMWPGGRLRAAAAA